jgi:hypothetical protein
VKYYLKSTALVLVTGSIVLIFLAGVIGSWRDLTMATVCAVFYTFTGFISFSFAVKLKSPTFYMIIFSSMLIRMVLMLTVVVAWVMSQSDNRQVFLIALIVWYMILLMPETVSFHKMCVRELA